MIWRIEFIKEAEEDLKHLDHSIQIQVLKGINKVSKNPLPESEGGYGKPLGHKLGINLTNLMKIKFKNIIRSAKVCINLKKKKTNLSIGLTLSYSQLPNSDDKT